MSAAEEVEYNSQYLQGNFKPMLEEITAENLEVIGEIPADLQGNFLRIGPNPYYVPDMEKYHIFDGDGMVHGLSLIHI